MAVPLRLFFGKCLSGAILSILLIQRASGDDLLPQGDLTEGLPTGDVLPAYVSFGAAADSAKASISDQAPAPGERTYCIERQTATGNSRVVFREPIPVTPRHRYYLSCQVKLTAGAAGVLVEPLDANRKAMARTGFEDVVSTNPDVDFTYSGRAFSLRRCLIDQPDNFSTLDMTFTVPDGVAFVTVSLNYSWTLGTAWYGEVKLLPLDEVSSSNP